MSEVVLTNLNLFTVLFVIFFASASFMFMQIFFHDAKMGLVFLAGLVIAGTASVMFKPLAIPALSLALIAFVALILINLYKHYKKPQFYAPALGMLVSLAVGGGMILALQQ
ncbi:hypothetical protein EUZ85_03650 [Hahella sp. KA22]|uniref:hypothetical protein n=1 Tax=Hahella sp. KA22 TaxID=1628392 RepID=UPI000FDEC8BB|nr:hypothetical protein [Hahella sp. KA22]AZZ89851.1 hypothetical protein ENC22_01105 [Hahella sp. KA22]QAY53220.1 hypothetical protein EUZ85_03650 [Hahella sp. KA22]